MNKTPRSLATSLSLGLLFSFAAARDAEARLQKNITRLDLDNGGEVAPFLQDPFVGSDPIGGDFGGDLYWKVFPGQAIQSCSGARTLWGTEQSLFDLDWSDSASLWSYLITGAFEGTDLTLRPVLDGSTLDNPGVFVPEIPNSGLTSPSGDCPKPGYVGGWILLDLFVDSSTGSMIPLMQATDAAADNYFRADGTLDWAFVHFFPEGQSLSQPNPNGCGSGFAGNATFQWFRSGDGGPPSGDGGENQGAATLVSDGAGTGGTATGFASRYGGFQFGGGGGLTPESQDAGADLAFLFQGPTLNLSVNTGYRVNGVLAPELGLAGLELPIGWNTATATPALKDSDAGAPGSTDVTLGVRLYDQTAKTDGSSIGAFGANIDFPGGSLDLLIDAGLCFSTLGGEFGLNPANSIFGPTLGATLGALTPFTLDASRGNDVVYVSPQLPLAPDPSLLGVVLAFQSWSFDITAPSPITGSSQIVRTRLRSNAGVD